MPPSLPPLTVKVLCPRYSYQPIDLTTVNSPNPNTLTPNTLPPTPPPNPLHIGQFPSRHAHPHHLSIGSRRTDTDTNPPPLGGPSKRSTTPIPNHGTQSGRPAKSRTVIPVLMLSTDPLVQQGGPGGPPSWSVTVGRFQGGRSPCQVDDEVAMSSTTNDARGGGGVSVLREREGVFFLQTVRCATCQLVCMMEVAGLDARSQAPSGFERA